MKYEEILARVRKLRKNMTPEEKLLWDKLRNKQFMGLKFLRQHPVFYQRNFSDHRFFVLDFYCSEYRLAIEIDGKIHYYTKEYDQWRTLILEDQEITVVRIKNEELKEIEKVLFQIKCAIENSPLNKKDK